MDLENYAKTLRELRNREDTLDAEMKAIEEKIDVLMPEFVGYMETNKLQNAHVKDVGTVFLQVRNYAKIIDETTLFAKLKESGKGSIIKETIYPSTLKGFANELLKNNEPLPAGMEVYSKTVVAIRKEKTE